MEQQLGEVRTWFNKKPGLEVWEHRETNVNVIFVFESCQHNKEKERLVTDREGRLCKFFIFIYCLMTTFNKFSISLIHLRHKVIYFNLSMVKMRVIHDLFICLLF